MDSQFATLFLGDYDDTQRRLRYVNCGHNPPLLLRAGGDVEWLAATATVLGAFQAWDCEVAEVDLRPGDLLVVYSDGVTEVFGADSAMFVEDHLLDVVSTHRDLGADDVLRAIRDAVAAFGTNGAEDDLTLLVARAR